MRLETTLQQSDNGALPSAANFEPLLASAVRSSNMHACETGSDLWIDADAHCGAPIVLLHGWPVTARYWERLRPLLRTQGWRTIAVEARGLGCLSKGTGSQGKPRLANEVATALKPLGLGPTAVLGHDWGGTIAVLLAAHSEMSVSALAVEEEILPASTASVDASISTYPTWHGPALRDPSTSELQWIQRVPAFLTRFLNESAAPAGLPVDFLEHCMHAYLAAGPLPTLALYRAGEVDRAAISALSDNPLRIPALSIFGRFGMGHAVADSLSLVAARQIKIECEQSGHYPSYQEPLRVAAAIKQWLTLPAGSQFGF